MCITKPLKLPTVVQWLSTIYPPEVSLVWSLDIQSLSKHANLATTTMLTTSTVYRAIGDSTAYQLR